MVEGREERLLRGGGTFVDSVRPDGALVMAVLRSPVAHGRIATLDVAEARAVPGVALVLTAADLAAAGVGPLACRGVVEGVDGRPMIEPRRPVLADDRVMYVGQPVAVVVAEGETAARDALDAIVLEIDDLPAVTDPAAAADGPDLWPEAPGNRSFTWQKGNAAETDRLLAEAAHVIELTVRHPRIAISAIEPRGCIAAPGAPMVLETPSQGVVSLRTAMTTCLGLAPGALRVVTRDVGGSFAVKIWPYPEHVLALHAARATGRTVAWTGTRSEAMTGDAAGRGRVDRARLGVDATGRILAFRIDAAADMGAFLGIGNASIVTGGAVRPFAQGYDIAGQCYRVDAVFTNAVPTEAYRGAGKPESTTTLERLVDLAARKLGLDPLEMRRRNLIRPERLPLATPMGETMDAGDYPALADKVAALADWPGLAARKSESAKRGLLRGAGIGFHTHATGGSTVERSEVRALADGTVLVRTGAQDTGQGHARALGRIAAEALELPEDAIRVEQGDSAHLEVGGGSGGSNLLPVAGPTVARAAAEMLETARTRAGDLLEAAVADLDYAGGTFRIAGTDRTVTLAEVAAAEEGGCAALTDFEGTHTTWPAGAYIAEVEVDPATGAVRLDRFTGVDDIGRVIDHEGAMAQLHGGIAQSVGEALIEGMVFDANGQPLTGSWMDYGVPRAGDMPMFDLDWAPTPSPNALLDAKGVGELPNIGAPAVIVNAVLDALAPLGVGHIDKPLTPARVWQAIREAGG